MFCNPLDWNIIYVYGSKATVQCGEKSCGVGCAEMSVPAAASAPTHPPPHNLYTLGECNTKLARGQAILVAAQTR